jgi:tRNA (guanine37-N1)-methyltransferase
MRFSILTLFPEALESYLAASILGRARGEQFIFTELVNIRDFATDKHKTVDDTPYGGGAGMVMKIEPIDFALSSIKRKASSEKRKIVVLSARGEQFTQAKAAEYAQLDELILICGRYEGIDQRVADHLADEEISIGPYVLAGGEIAALAVLEATARLLPGVLGNEESLLEESYSSRNSNTEYRSSKQAQISNDENSNLISDLDVNASDLGREYPHYTKPADYKGWKVPEVLLSGNHEEIRRWRGAQ